jgi:hypothetical protein
VTLTPPTNQRKGAPIGFLGTDPENAVHFIESF